ncbi:MAG: hypothetical protein WCI45_02205 [Desulfuromonadales bacterium]
MSLKLILLSIGIVALSGCASVTGTTGQSVSVQTREQSGKEVSGAVCELTNNKGKWFVTTPGSVGINRSNDDLQVLCNKESYEPGRVAVVSVTKGAMFGNIILGGGIGAIVDHNTGAAYEYPAFFQVVMGSFSKVEPPKNQPSDSALPAVAPIAAQPSVSTSQNVAPPLTGQVLQPQEQKLIELKRLFDAGLITNEAYVAQQRVILSR